MKKQYASLAFTLFEPFRSKQYLTFMTSDINQYENTCSQSEIKAREWYTKLCAKYVHSYSLEGT